MKLNKVHKVWLMWQSERMFKVFEMSTSGSNAGAEGFTPLVDGVVVKAMQLLYTNQPHDNQTAIQIVQILSLCLVNSVLHNVPDLVVDRSKVWAIQLFALSLTSVRLRKLWFTPTLSFNSIFSPEARK